MMALTTCSFTFRARVVMRLRSLSTAAVDPWEVSPQREKHRAVLPVAAEEDDEDATEDEDEDDAAAALEAAEPAALPSSP